MRLRAVRTCTACHGASTPSRSRLAADSGKGSSGKGGRSSGKKLRLGRDSRGRPNQSKVEFERLFWLRRPRLMLRVFQYAYFENALSLSVVVFGLWQKESKLFAGVGTSSSISSPTFVITLVLVVIDLMLLVHSASLVLPVYALTAASVHYQSPDALLEFAKKRGIRPDLVELLEADEADDLVRWRSFF